MKIIKNLPLEMNFLDFGNKRLLENLPQRNDTNY
jgi:hypothetical protein